MLEGITLDQLRVFVAVVEAGSFSAAARRLRRVQSAVSQAIANLEGQLGLKLWDRSRRVPVLTDQGKAVLSAARRVLTETESLFEVATTFSGGLEPRIGIAVDAIFPVGALVEACRSFQRAFPAVHLTVLTETLSAVTARVLDGTCDLGIAGPAAGAGALERQHLGRVLMIPVCAPGHPLAEVRGKIPARRAAEHVQIVLAERDTASPDQGVLSPQTWRIADLATKHQLLLAGLGFGNMPEHVVREDLARGRLLRLRLAAWADEEHLLSLSAVHRRGVALGPAARWMLARLGELCVEALEPRAARNRGG